MYPWDERFRLQPQAAEFIRVTGLVVVVLGRPLSAFGVLEPPPPASPRRPIVAGVMA